MRIYPAIDIKDGKCVRLLQGRFSDMTVYGSDPAEIAKRWEDEGAQYLHIVDLDGAQKGRGVNADIIKKICRTVQIPVQTGGGIREMKDVEDMLQCGAERVIIGTSAVKKQGFAERAIDKFGERIVIGIDAKDSMVAVEGWEEVSTLGALDFAKEMEKIGAKTIVYTDITTDGTLRGPNFAAMKEMAGKCGLDVIASGGVGNEEHISLLEKTGVEGVIVGRALYTGDVDLKRILGKI